MTTIPSPREVLDRVLRDELSELHTAFPAEVIAYDVAAQTVDLRPAIMREYPGNDEAPWDIEALPDLVNVPVMWPRAGGFALTFPLAVGDSVLCVCSEQATGLWRRRGIAPSEPGFIDPHGLNGCVAIPGWFPDTRRLRNVSPTAVTLGNEAGTTRLTIRPSGTVLVEGLQVVLGAEAGALPVALAASVQSAMVGLGNALTAAAAALPADDPFLVAAKAAATSLASAAATWAATVSVGATRVRGV